MNISTKGSTRFSCVGPFFNLIGLVYALSLSGCAYAIKSRITPLAPPETMGQNEHHAPRIALGLDSVVLQSTEVSPDKWHALIDTRSPKLRSDISVVGLRGAVAAANWLDLGINLGLGGNPEITAQLQLLGDPRNQAVAGNLAWSVLARVGGGSSRDVGAVNADQRDWTSSRYTVEKKEFQTLWGSTFGYRVNDVFLPYLGAIGSRHQFSGTHEVGVQKVEKRPFSGYSESKGALIGASLRFLNASGIGSRPPSVFSLTLETVWAQTLSGSSKGYGWHPAGSGTLEF
jgi:hypothetical protein